LFDSFKLLKEVNESIFKFTKAKRVLLIKKLKEIKNQIMCKYSNFEESNFTVKAEKTFDLKNLKISELNKNTSFYNQSMINSMSNFNLFPYINNTSNNINNINYNNNTNTHINDSHNMFIHTSQGFTNKNNKINNKSRNIKEEFVKEKSKLIIMNKLNLNMTFFANKKLSTNSDVYDTITSLRNSNNKLRWI